MRGMARPLGLVALTSALFVLAVSPSTAQAAFGIAKWEAVTCKEDKTLTGEPCLGTETSKLFTQAAAHPNFGITDFRLNTGVFELPEGNVKDIVVELPEGLGVSPAATPQCTVQQLSEVKEVLPGPIIVPKCPESSRVGTDFFRAIVAAGPPPVAATIPLAVYNIETPTDPADPLYGVPSMAGFNATGKPTLLVGDLDPVDQHITFTISDIGTTPPVIGSRLVFVGTAGDGYLTMPSVCAGGQTTVLKVDSHQEPGNFQEASYTTLLGATGCDIVPFDPKLFTTVDSATDSPEPFTAELQIPFEKGNPGGITNSELKKASVTLPEGMGINPSSANGLVPCTDAQFAKGTDDPITCPAESKVGTVEVETPSLPGIFGGTVYVGEPLSNDPSSGNQFRTFIHVFSERFGVNVRLVGNVFPNLQTGQLTTVVEENPQAPFSSFKVHLNGGPKGTLTTPGTCGPHTTIAAFTPWANPGKEVPPKNKPQFTLDTLPGGGPCPQTLAERPFDPSYKAGPQGSKAGAFSPFHFLLERPDGAQEVKRVDVNLPPGMSAKLRGLDYCPEESIDAAAKQTGAEVIAKPVCPDSSFVGTSSADTGSGPEPFHTAGNVYLAGPYKGAPVSLVFVTPAVAGPYDLGTVVVRVALNIDPETAEVHSVSDTIPDVFGGVKLDIRKIDVSINRKNFTLNPTTCREPFAVKSEIFGGGGNPADPAAWSKTTKETPFRATECRELKFKPQFFARIFGGENQTRRAANPKFRAIFDPRDGDANLRRAAFILPRATILDQGHIKTICTRVQLAADNCPQEAIYGNAKARSPLLDGVLKGPVYLTSSDNPLPDLLVDLRGQVDIRLRGVISSENARLKTVFRSTPDVPVDKFTLTMKGGNRGLLVNSQDLCDRPRAGFLNLLAQNSRRLRSKNLRLNIPACR